MKYKFIILFVVIVCNTIVFAQDDVLERKDFNFAMGIALLSGCGSSMDEAQNSREKTRFCIAVPTLNLSAGYNFTPQLKVNLETQTLMVGGFVGIEAQYYIKDEVNSMYVYTGAMKGYMLDVGFSETLGSFGVGYVKEHMEYEVGIAGKSADVFLNLSLKYMF